jgi:hypothetical protein
MVLQSISCEISEKAWQIRGAFCRLSTKLSTNCNFSYYLSRINKSTMINFWLIHPGILKNYLQTLQEQLALSVSILIAWSKMTHAKSQRFWKGIMEAKRPAGPRSASIRRYRWQSYLSQSVGPHPGSDCYVRFRITAAVLWVTLLIIDQMFHVFVTYFPKSLKMSIANQGHSRCLSPKSNLFWRPSK